MQVHLPSLTAFSNFPEGQDALRIPLCMDFSTRSGYFAVGNQKGEALLYRFVIQLTSISIKKMFGLFQSVHVQRKVNILNGFLLFTFEACLGIIINNQ